MKDQCWLGLVLFVSRLRYESVEVEQKTVWYAKQSVVVLMLTLMPVRNSRID